jgi:arylsulfatase A-like enzyme
MFLGILIGSIVGLCTAVPALIANGFVKHRMLYSTALVLRSSIDHSVLAACLVMYGIRIGMMLRSWARYLWFLSVPAVCIGVAIHRLGNQDRLRFVFRDVSLDFVKQFFLQGFPQIIAAGIVVALGIVMIRRMRRNVPVDATPEAGIKPEVPAQAPVPQKVGASKRAFALYALFFVGVAVLNILPALLRVKSVHDAGKGPNIIYIMVDTLRADHLGCYGYSRDTSPNIDKLAAESMRFEKAISQAPWTTASVASFMSSRYLHIEMNAMAMVPSNVVLMPELLKDRGYETGAVISNALAGRGPRLARGYDHYYEMQGDEAKTIEGKYGLPDTVFTKSVQMLRQMKDRRFFMFTLFIGPHSPYASHKEYNFASGYKGKLGRDGVFVEGRHFKGDDLRYAEALYDGEIAYTDRYVGLLIAELKKLNLYDNTVIVLLADHGEEFEEHGKMSHGEHLYDESIHVPLIVKLPGQKEGSVVRGAFPLINLLPSVADYIHCDTSALEFQGTAVRLEGLRAVRQTDVYSSTDFHEARLQSLRGDKSKLIVDIDTDKAELYDLASDPFEKRNIAADSRKTTSEYESALRSVNARIDAALEDVVNKPLSPQDAAEMQKSMRALGYLQ